MLHEISKGNFEKIKLLVDIIMILTWDRGLYHDTTLVYSAWYVRVGDMYSPHVNNFEPIIFRSVRQAGWPGVVCAFQRSKEKQT